MAKKSNKNEDFEVIISDLDNKTTLVTSNDDDKVDIDKIWKRRIEQATYNFDTKQHLYSTTIKDGMGAQNAVTIEQLDEYANNPQNNLGNIQEINNIIKNFVNKDDIIGRIYECIQMYTNTSYNLIFRKDSKTAKTAKTKTKKVNEIIDLVEKFNNQINIKQFLKEGVPLSYLNGNYITYLRNTKDGNYVIDKYPLGVVEITEFNIDGEPVVVFNVDTLRRKLKVTNRKNKKNKDILFETVDKIVKESYPEEVYKAFANNEKYVVLNQERVGVVRINNLDGLYGLSPIFKALKPAILLDSIGESDDSTIRARGKKIIHQKLRKEIGGSEYQKQSLSEMAYAHDNLIEAWKNKTVLVTTPWWVESIEYVEPKTDTTNKDTLNTYRNKEFTSLGISFLDTYNAELNISKISLSGLMKYIDTIVLQFAHILNKYYKVVLNDNHKDLNLCPEVQISCAESMAIDMKMKIAEFLFTKLGASYKTTYDVLGVSNAETEANNREQEDAEGYNDTFKPHENYFTQTNKGNDNVGGRPAGEETKKQNYDKTRNELNKKGGEK